MSLTPRSQDFSAWYNELVEQAKLAQHSDVRGSMVVRPHGFALWEQMKEILDGMFKATGHQNAYFPLLIPKSYFAKEADHVDGFAKESAVVTHYRLKTDKDSGELIVDPDAKLEEELIIRPTSEAIIWNTYKDRIQSYRDLPILVNQWANVMRREMRTRLFLRTSEFLWQEGHTAHASEDEALKEAETMRKVYDEFLQNALAIDGYKGVKSESERFAGAETTYTIEAMMQDGKALQFCTSHYLGQNFGKAFDVEFLNADNKLEHAYASSWGLSTRSIGGLIMSHSDDKGLVLPPALASTHIVIVPFFRSQEDLETIQEYIQPTLNDLSNKTFDIETSFKTFKRDITTTIDTDPDKSMGWKLNEYELQGIPVRLTIGKREIDQGVVEVYRRDTGEKSHVAIDSLADHLFALLHKIQTNLLNNNITMRNNNTVFVDTYEEFKTALEDGKFVFAHRDGSAETEEIIQQECKSVTRCIPLKKDHYAHADKIFESGTCIKTGKPSTQRVLFARSY